ncbi:FAD-dependent oxidoreductase [Desulfobacter postgatei]|jgi:NADPH-dependent 2,4-dienoyl-CoA reductase/sulfur reductase-like enzyme|nr:FAD-dependent oxidoreductase [Desulfobacter postgatei]MDX9964869.1 FAD-dependent oxidoreductase [Desulfobacter postgatei]
MAGNITIIGAGPAGYAAALRAAGLGAQVTLKILGTPLHG